MAAEDINFMNAIELKLEGIAKGVGVEFKQNSSTRRQSTNFREQMKEKQRNNRKKD